MAFNQFLCRSRYFASRVSPKTFLFSSKTPFSTYSNVSRSPIRSPIRGFGIRGFGWGLSSMFSTKSESGVVVRFDDGEKQFRDKISLMKDHFPPVGNDPSMRMTAPSIYMFFGACYGSNSCIYPLISLETAWCLGVQVQGKLYVFEEENLFSKSVAPHLNIKRDDMVYLKHVKFTSDYGHLDFFCIEKAVTFLSLGYSENKSNYFMECLALIYWAVIRASMSPKMLEFVCEILGDRYSGDGKLPTSITSIFASWEEISRWYFSGGVGIFEPSGMNLNLSSMKDYVSIVKSEEERGESGMKSWNPNNMTANAQKRKDKFLEDAQKKLQLFMGQQNYRRKQWKKGNNDKGEREFEEEEQNMYKIFMEQQEIRWKRFCVEEEKRSQRIEEKFKPKKD